MLLFCLSSLCIGLVIVVIFFVLNNNSSHIDLQQLRDNHFKRKAKWLPSPFNVGLPKPNGVWKYNPSKKIENDLCPGTFIGRQVWTFHAHTDKTTATHEDTKSSFEFDSNVNPNSSDKPLRSQLAAENASASTTKLPDDANAIDRALHYYLALQNRPDGFWGGDYGGPMFLLPGLIIACFISRHELSSAHKYEMVRYLLNHQQIDGGWGLHIEAPSCMFTTVLNYVSLRILGVDATHPACALALRFIRDNNVLSVPAWCKWYLCILNVFDYRAMEFAIPCELWLLPHWFPFHPKNLWCHCRIVYLPMSLLYSARYQCSVDDYPLIAELRAELLPSAFERMDWTASHFKCHRFDQIVPIPSVAKLLCRVLYAYEWCIGSGPWQWLRRRGCAFALDYIENEDAQTSFVNLGPVNKALNLIAIYFDSKAKHLQDGAHYKRQIACHQARLMDYLWLSEDGMKMQGYNGSHLWDTSFALEGIYEYATHARNKNGVRECLQLGLHYLEQAQIVSEVESPGSNPYFRCQQKGAWPFSNRDHGWPITDCTSQGLKCALLLQSHLYGAAAIDKFPIGERRLRDAVDCILNWQNSRSRGGDGGWSTYERNRGYAAYEVMNPSQVFMNIMIDYSHIECTSSCIQALCMFTQFDARKYRAHEIREAVRAGVQYLKRKQGSEGEFLGFWAVCCCYAIWFAGMAFKMSEQCFGAADGFDNAAEMHAIETFLVAKQNEDGGWGESYLSCIQQQYVSAPSQVINTAWSLLSLLCVESTDSAVLQRAKQFILDRQLDNGDWPQENISGVFNHTCMISYSNYRNIFPIWALSKYYSVYGKI